MVSVITSSPRVCVFAAAICFSCVSAFGQSVALIDGSGVAKFGHPIAAGPPQGSPASASAPAGAGLTFFTQSYQAFDVMLPMNIVGTDPALGAATTTIPSIVVPLKFVFANGGATLDGTARVATTVNSPMFQSVDFTTGGTDIGVTQYGDAIQRGEFWNYPGFSPDYHVLLGDPVVADTVTVNVPANQGFSRVLPSGTVMGQINLSYFDALLETLRAPYTADQLPIFLSDNVFLFDAGGCCILGFHNSEREPIATARTWIFAAFTEPGTFGSSAFLDTTALSHEVAEWLNDPFVGTSLFGGINLIPPAVLPGTGGACIINFETGDPLEAPPIEFTQTINGTTYHLQDEVFLTWFLHTTPSFSVNGFYTFLGTFPTPSTLCAGG